MVLRSNFRAAALGLLAAVCATTPLRALLTFNDGADHVFLIGSGSVAYDSNIFARRGGEGDTIYSAGLTAEYTRQAGLIAVDASLAVNASHFRGNPNQSFIDPAFKAEFKKARGRTTGALIVGLARASEADRIANTRTDSWNYSTDLKLNYPVIERYSFAGHLGYTDRNYVNTAELADLRTYVAGTDLLYAIDSGRSLLVGGQFRHEATSAHATFVDQAVTVGLTGRIYSKLSGSVRLGYQSRSPRGGTADGSFHGLTASAEASVPLSKKVRMAMDLSKDVQVTSDNQSTDSFSTGLRVDYTLNDGLSVSGNIGVGRNSFLNLAANGRRDTYFSWGTGLKYKMNEHVDSTLGYVFDENWSTFTFSDFNRHIATFTLSSRW